MPTALSLLFAAFVGLFLPHGHAVANDQTHIETNETEATPSVVLSGTPSVSPSVSPRVSPSVSPSATPSVSPSVGPSVQSRDRDDSKEDNSDSSRGEKEGFFNGFPFGFFVREAAHEKNAGKEEK